MSARWIVSPPLLIPWFHLEWIGPSLMFEGGSISMGEEVWMLGDWIRASVASEWDGVVTSDGHERSEWWCDGVMVFSLVLSSVAPTLVSYNVAPTLFQHWCYTVSYTDHTVSLLHWCHTLTTHHLDRSSPFEAIDWMINSVIPETHTLSLKLLHPISSSLTHLHSLSLFNSLPWCRPVTISTLSSHMVSYYHQVFSHTTCALIPSHLTECSLTLSFHQLPISWCPTTTKSSLTTCALIVIPHTQVIPLITHTCYPWSSHWVISPRLLSHHVLSLMLSLHVLTHMVSSYHQVFSHQCYPCCSLTSTHSSSPWCSTITKSSRVIPEHSLTQSSHTLTHTNSSHSSSPWCSHSSLTPMVSSHHWSRYPWSLTSMLSLLFSLTPTLLSPIPPIPHIHPLIDHHHSSPPNHTQSLPNASTHDPEHSQSLTTTPNPLNRPLQPPKHPNHTHNDNCSTPLIYQNTLTNSIKKMG